MSEKLTCEFRLKPGTKYEEPCADPAGTYEIESLCRIEMDLCDRHRNYIIANYGWTVTKIEDKEKECQQDTQNQNQSS